MSQEDNRIIIKHNATDSYERVYDILMQGVRDRFLNPGAEIVIRLRGSAVSDYTTSVMAKVYDMIEYEPGPLRKYGREPDPSIAYLKDDPFDRSMYQRILEEEIGDVGMKEFMFVERRILDQLEKIVPSGSKRMGKTKERHLRRPTKRALDLERFKNKKIRYSNISEHPKSSIVSELYKIDIDKLRFDQLNYYFAKPMHQYLPYDHTVEMLLIDPYDYIRSIRAAQSKHNTESYYQKLLDDTKFVNALTGDDNKRIDELDLDESTMDFVATTYVRYRPSAFVLTVWKPAVKYVDTLLDELNNTGNVYYVKKLNVSHKVLEGMMFWMYDEFSFQKRQEFIDKKLSYIGAGADGEETTEVCIIVYDNVHNKPLAGQASKYKRYIRDMLLDKVDPDRKTYRGNDLIHVNDYHYQTIEYCENFFNANTLNMYAIQDRTLFLNNTNAKSNLVLQTYRAFLYQKLGYDEIDRLITIGSMSLYAYGVRRNTDIDSVMVDSSSNIGSPGLTKKIEHHFSDKRTRFKFADIGVMGSPSWNPNWTDKNDEWFSRIKDGPSNIYDAASNPAHYFYFQGIKVLLLDYEVVRKLMRFEAHDILDLLVMNLKGLESDYYELESRDKIDAALKLKRTRSIAPITTKNFDVHSRGTHGKNWAIPDLIDKADDYDKDGLLKYVTQAMNKRYDPEQIEQFLNEPSVKLLLNK